MRYVFLTPNNPESEIDYYAIDSDKIETLYVSETYTKYGQQVSPSEAGDYLVLTSDKAVELANKFYQEDNETQETHYSIGDIVSAYDNKEYEQITNSHELIEDDDYSLYKETCRGFNYWNGSNWATILLGDDYNSFSLVTDEELNKELNQAIVDKEYVRDGLGCEIYETSEYIIEDNYCQGVWASYHITEKFKKNETRKNYLR